MTRPNLVVEQSAITVVRIMSRMPLKVQPPLPYPHSPFLPLPLFLCPFHSLMCSITKIGPGPRQLPFPRLKALLITSISASPSAPPSPGSPPSRPAPVRRTYCWLLS